LRLQSADITREFSFNPISIDKFPKPRIRVGTAVALPLINDQNPKEVRRMRKLAVVLALAVIVVLGVTYAFAQGPGYGRGGRGNAQGFDRWSSLTPEQKTKMQELRQKFIDETAQLRGKMVTARLELQSLWANPKADSKAIEEKSKEMGTLQSQMREKAVQFRLEARKNLTPEQITQLGPGSGMGPGFGGRGMMGNGPGAGCGNGRGQGFGRGPGYGRGMGFGMGL
jgi:zinc resistance-associated protein